MPKAKSYVMKEQDAGVDQDSATTAPAAAPVMARIEAEDLTEEQQAAAQRALAGESLFLTGAAGTGKSFLLRYLVQELQLMHPNAVAITASTGIAAANIGGQTIHSFSGIGLGKGTARHLLNTVKKSATAVRRWQTTRVLVIDEISMLDGEIFSALEDIAAHFRRGNGGPKIPFGGLQLILCGDFLQLPPVQGRGEREKMFCFQTKAWTKCGLDRGKVILRQSVRQAADAVFATILNDVRIGRVSALAEEKLAECNVDCKPPPTDGIVPTKLYCLNRNVDAENNAQLERLDGEKRTFVAKDVFKGCRSSRERAILQDVAERRSPSFLTIKVGAQVILTKNQPTIKLVNGSRGVVESFHNGYPLVRFDTGVAARIGLETSSTQYGTSEIQRIQVPLKLGWALTVHKAQGMTLSRAELQVDNAFEAGQVYVALSRLTSLNGLWIRGKGLSVKNTRASSEVLSFYSAPEAGYDPKLANELGVDANTEFFKRSVQRMNAAKSADTARPSRLPVGQEASSSQPTLPLSEAMSSNPSPYFDGPSGSGVPAAHLQTTTPSRVGPPGQRRQSKQGQQRSPSGKAGTAPPSTKKRRRLKPAGEGFSQPDESELVQPPSKAMRAAPAVVNAAATDLATVWPGAPLGHPSAPATPSRARTAQGFQPAHSAASAPAAPSDPSLPKWTAGPGGGPLLSSQAPAFLDRGIVQPTVQQPPGIQGLPPSQSASPAMQLSPGGTMRFGELPGVSRAPAPSRAAIRNQLVWRATAAAPPPAPMSTTAVLVNQWGAGFQSQEARTSVEQRSTAAAQCFNNNVEEGCLSLPPAHAASSVASAPFDTGASMADAGAAAPRNWISPPRNWGGVIDLD